MERAPEPTPVRPMQASRAPTQAAALPTGSADSPQPTLVRPAQAATPPPRQSKPARVLIVEDEPALQRALRINLRARGYEVATAAGLLPR